jgi:hypothetical protein
MQCILRAIIRLFGRVLPSSQPQEFLNVLDRSMSLWTIWKERFDPPSKPTTARLHTPWFVLINSNCPVCNDVVTEEGRLTHPCGELLDVRSKTPKLIRLIQYPIGYTLVRSERWERFLIKTNSKEIELDTRVPLSSLHAAPWVIWNGQGVSTWPMANTCPECGKSHVKPPQNTFRCDCQARLLPVSMNWAVSLEKKDLIAKLWEEQAFFMKVKGVHVLLSIHTVPSSP